MIQKYVFYIFLFITCSCAKKKNEEVTLPKRPPCEKVSVTAEPQYKYKFCNANMTYGYMGLGISLADSMNLEHLFISIPDYFQFKKEYNGKKVSDLSLFSGMTLGLKNFHCNGCEPCGNQFIDYTAVSIKGITLTDTTSLVSNGDYVANKEYIYLSIVGAKFVNLTLKDTFYLDSIFVPKVKPGIINENI